LPARKPPGTAERIAAVTIGIAVLHVIVPLRCAGTAEEFPRNCATGVASCGAMIARASSSRNSEHVGGG
jgi:hypothetical protein